MSQASAAAPLAIPGPGTSERNHVDSRSLQRVPHRGRWGGTDAENTNLAQKMDISAAVVETPLVHPEFPLAAACLSSIGGRRSYLSGECSAWQSVHDIVGEIMEVQQGSDVAQWVDYNTRLLNIAASRSSGSDSTG